MDFFDRNGFLSFFVSEFPLDPWVISEIVLVVCGERLAFGISMLELAFSESLVALVLAF